MSNETSRPTFEEKVRSLLKYRKETPEAMLPNTGICPDLLSCDESTLTLELSYKLYPWMRNPVGVLHGGVAGILVDNAMGIACNSACAAHTPTISMTVNYIRPVPLDGPVTVRSHVVSCGRSMAYASAEIFLHDQPDRILITATGVYSTKLANK